jgi:hypothetical protein
MRLDCFKIHDVAPEIVPARTARDWMDAFPDLQPYRCLPLSMANATGWEILCPMDLKVSWNGGPETQDLEFFTTGDPAAIASFADSHFRRGIVTFHTGHLFRTDPGWGVWVSGPPNWPKDGISPLTGLVETDWLPFPFTMNWQMTRPGEVVFRKGEPFAFLTLLEHHRLEAVQPVLRKLDTEPELHAQFQTWRDSRADFNARLGSGETEALKERWQRHYMRGDAQDGTAAPQHKTKRRMKPPQ